MLSRQDECRCKHRKVVQFMEGHRLDAVILTRRCNFAWYTAGGSNHVSTASEVGANSLLVTPEGAVCIANTIEAPRLTAEELGDLGIEVRTYTWHDPADASRTWSQAIGNRRAAGDVPTAGLPPQVEPLGSDFDTLRWTLLDSEIDRYRTLAGEVAASLEAACQAARPGMTEHQLAAQLSASLLARGILTPVVLVAADERVRSYRHPLPTMAKLHKYGMAVCGGQRHGLIVSCTRLVSFGPVSADLRRRHEAVCRVDASMIAATRPGSTLGEVFAVAQGTYAQVGFPDEWTRHHQGGSTGYCAREAKARPGDPTPILANQVFAWNPSIAGTKSEDTILVGAEKNDILSTTGNWPNTHYEAGGTTWPRCDILEL